MDLDAEGEPAPIEWRTAAAPVDYGAAVAAMEARVQAIRTGGAPELVWLLEHPPLYTAGTSARDEELLDPARLPVHRTGRGGRWTYHGPGQRVAYVLLDLARRRLDVHCFVHYLETWGIATLARFGVTGERRAGRVGVWVERGAGEAKIVAIGVRVRRSVSYHGLALNLDPDLDAYRGIVPCGIAEHGVTSLAALGVRTTTADVDAVLRANFAAAFEPAAACR
jgi:lipoyl(octanoyl) transferase